MDFGSFVVLLVLQIVLHLHSRFRLGSAGPVQLEDAADGRVNTTTHADHRTEHHDKRRLSPIVFLPGNGGSQLQARMDSTYVPPSGCTRQSEWFRLWLDVTYMFTGDVHCWVDAMKLRYNKTSRKSSNTPGVDIRVPDFGVTDSVEYIDPSWVAWAVGNVGMYAAPLVDKLQEWGYVRNQDIRGAPYDFRFAPHSMGSYFRALRGLVENTYAANGRARVSLVGHSMGGLVALYFLNRQPQAWKDHYIHRLITLNTPWKGTTLVTQALATGRNWDQDNLDPWLIRDQQRTQESAALLIPSPEAWPRHMNVVSTPRRNYTARDLYDSFLDDIGYPVGKEMLRDLQTDDYRQANPGVKTLCVYTYGQPTADTYIYTEDFSTAKKPAVVVTGNGDGSVNYRSLRGCRSFRVSSVKKRGAKGRVYLRGFKGPSHDGIFTDSRVHELLKRALRHS